MMKSKQPVSLSRYQMVIFDWDGTLMDSTGKIIHCMQTTIREMQLPSVSEKTIASVIGLSMDRALNQLFPGIKPKQIEGFYRSYAEHYAQDSMHTPLLPGVLDLLDALHRQSTKLAIATGKSRAGLTRVLAQAEIGHYFHFSICADEAASKPSPVMIKYLLSQAGCLPDHALMIGDSRYDCLMARNAGTDFVGVLTGSDSRQVLQEAGSNWVVENVGQLHAWL